MIYVDIMTKFRLLAWTSFIGQFVQPVVVEGYGIKGMDNSVENIWQ